MSTEPRFAPASSLSVHIPLAILALAIAIFFFSQKSAVSTQTDLLKYQIENFEKEKERLTKLEAQLKEAVNQPQRALAIARSTEVQQKFQLMLNDLLELAKDDADAKQLVQAFGIQVNPPAAAPAAGAAPAATPAPTP